MNNQYPMQGMAQQLQAQGRYGDDVLVHMNPAEVRGLASLSPTGQLTRNPQTGQPEAFLPMLIPVIASMGGSAAAGAMGAGVIGSAVAGGLASGVATGAITGDWERGLASGIIGAGVGGALGAAGTAAGEAAAAGTDVAVDAATEAALGEATNSVIKEGMEQALIDQAAVEAGGEVAQQAIMDEAAQQALSNATVGAGDIGVAGTDIGVQGSAGVAPPTEGFGSGFDPSKFSGESFANAFKQPFQEGSGLGGKLMSSQTLLPVAAGYGQLAEMDANEAWEKDAKKRGMDDDAEREASYNRLQAAYAMAQPDTPTGRSPDRDGEYAFIPEWWKPEGYAAGGQVGNIFSIDGAGAGGYGFGEMGGFGNYRGVGRDPLSIHRGLRGKYSVSPHQMTYDPSDMYYAEDQYEYSPDDMIYQDSDYIYADDQYDWGEDSYNKKGRLKKPKRRGEKVLIPGATKTLRPGAVGTPREGAEMVLKAGAKQSVREGAIGTPNNYRAGFDPEFMYFQDDPDNVVVPDSFTDAQKARLYPELQRLEPSQGSYFDEFGSTAPPPTPPDGGVPPIKGGENNKIMPIDPAPDNGMAAGGEVQVSTDWGDTTIPGGGIASLPSQYVNPQDQGAPVPPMRQPQADNPSPPMAQPEAGGQPSDQDIQALALALTGQLGDKRDMVVERFIREFGVRTFQEARDFILKFAAGGNAQTEGMIQGAGGGMDDMVQGTIGGQEPVAVSPGEYIVPADVVSGLGDGSSDAGSAELDQMSERVRMARGGSTSQPPPFNANTVLPV